MYALIDCNNFYASCERLFRPDLQQKPIIVLSSNDGCVIARSNEAKALGIAMGEPFFKVSTLCRRHQVQVFSSNFCLYGDLSHRVMSTIIDAWPEIEVYSIDEAFLDLRTLPNEKHSAFCHDLQRIILKHTGIPTSIGIGKTKTLAKAANHIAKKILKTPVVNFNEQPSWLNHIPIGEIWGVGRRYQKKLTALNLHTAEELAASDPQFIRTRFGITLQRTVLELQGIPCGELTKTMPKQSVLSSKSFGHMQTEYDALAQAISSHCARAFEKIRQQQSVVGQLSVFVYSNRFRKDLTQYRNAAQSQFLHPSDDLRTLTTEAKRLLKIIYKPGIHYHKVGILFSQLSDKNHQQQSLFLDPKAHSAKKTEHLMLLLDQTNQRFGRNTIRLAAEGKSQPWSPKSARKSPRYTTQWHELPEARLGKHRMPIDKNIKKT